MSIIEELRQCANTTPSVMHPHWTDSAVRLMTWAANTIEAANNVINEQRAEVEALRKDAQRYDYLRSRKRDSVLYERYAAAGVWCDCENEDGVLTLLTGDDLDAAIDSAMMHA